MVLYLRQPAAQFGNSADGFAEALDGS